MKRVILLFLLLGGCGYTTYLVSSSLGEGKIYVKPVANEVRITSEDRAYSDYTVYPVLLDKDLTNAIIDELQIRTPLKVVSSPDGAYTLECKIVNYKKEALRYTDTDEVNEQRLRLYVKVIVYDAEKNLIKEREVVGEASYFFSGRLASSESEALNELIEDTAKRVVDTLSQDW